MYFTHTHSLSFSPFLWHSLLLCDCRWWAFAMYCLFILLMNCNHVKMGLSLALALYDSMFVVIIVLLSVVSYSEFYA